MTTYVLRHGRTSYSSRHIVNGDPSVPVLLDDDGVRTCRAARSSLALGSVRTWIVSEFVRTQQTTIILQAGNPQPLTIDARLNELDYGTFEGGPFIEYAKWLADNGPRATPPHATESQHEGIRRMLTGLSEALKTPSPRLVVAHGLLLSVLAWQRDRSPGDELPLFLPEAAYLDPFEADDAAMRRHITRLFDVLDDHNQRQLERLRPAPFSGTATGQFFASVDPPHKPFEE